MTEHEEPERSPSDGPRAGPLGHASESDEAIDLILAHIGEPSVAPPIAPARAPPGLPADADRRPGSEIGAEPVPAIDFDQRHGW